MTDRSTARRLAPEKQEVRAKKAALGRELRRAYEAYADDETPKEFLELLEAADRAAEKSANKRK